MQPPRPQVSTARRSSTPVITWSPENVEKESRYRKRSTTESNLSEQVNSAFVPDDLPQMTDLTDNDITITSQQRLKPSLRVSGFVNEVGLDPNKRRSYSLPKTMGFGKPASGRDTSSVGSVGDLTTISTDSEEKWRFTKNNLSTLSSVMYATLVVVMSFSACLSDLIGKSSGHLQILNAILAVVGISFLIFIHMDIQSYKAHLMKKLFPDDNIFGSTSFPLDDVERLSATTEVLCNNTGTIGRGRSVSTNSIAYNAEVPAYRFLRGRESGSFYLKLGMAAFCFGHVVHEGLMLAQQIYFITSGQRRCLQIPKLFLHVVRPLFSFYQLFIAFKYSNIVINRHLNVARMGLMHLMGTSAAFWLSAIIDEGIEYLQQKHGLNMNNNGTTNGTSATEILSESFEKSAECNFRTFSNSNYNSALPYLYPFAIEFNLLLAALWFIVWLNSGKDSHSAHPHPFQQKVSQDPHGREEVHYESNLVIRVDCHASNKGLFGGSFILLVSVVAMIVFFVLLGNERYVRVAISINSIQEIFLQTLIIACTIIAYKQIRTLDINPIKHHSETLDLILLLVPVPFYFFNNALSLRSEIARSNWMGVAGVLIATLYVLLQTAFITDAMYRCAEGKCLRFKKPGRELITFLIILNITLWIVSTFETKAVESHHSQPEYYGKITWMVISHTTLPLMLFYKFHSTVCLADIWKYAYEKSTA